MNLCDLRGSSFGMATRNQKRETRNGDLRVSSWAELNNALFAETWNPDLRRFRSNFVYRGMPDANEDLRTSLMRLGGNVREIEAHLLRNFRKYARRETLPEGSIWDWLALAAHHGLPTRLLDFSYSPYVALHFATCELDRYDSDGAIWAVAYVEAHRLLPRRLRTILSRERSNAFTIEMLNEAASSLAALEKLAPREFALFFEPPSLDDRIVNQFALFAMMSSPEARLDAWLSAQHPRLARRIVIPAKLKWEARDKLDQANITERVLFPGLDGLSLWLRRHYVPK